MLVGTLVQRVTARWPVQSGLSQWPVSGDVGDHAN